MPGAFTIDTPRTFALLMLMSTTRKTKFGTDEPDLAADGRPKWSAQVAGTWLAEPGRRPVSEVLEITITADRDPGESIPPGSPVHIEGLRVGVSTPERTERGVRGGRAWYSADALRPAQARQAGKDAA
jgi:hypothetical protein